MDQAANLASDSGLTIASILQQFSHRVAPRRAGAVPLADGPGKEDKGLKIGITELQSGSSSTLPCTPRTPNKTFSEQQLKRWPQEPQPITNEPIIERCLDLIDVILCILPCVLILKAGLCIWAFEIDKTHVGASIDKTSQLTLKLIQFNGQLTTIFTIIFIVIISTAVRRYALWKAERGATIGEIEQLQASISLTATLRAIWSLRTFTFTSLGLIFVWAWYYVGSQAASKEYLYRDSDSFSTQYVGFLGPQARSPFQDGSINQYSPVRLTDMTAHYHMYSQFTSGTQRINPQDAKAVQGADIYGATLTPWFGPALGHPWADLDFDSNNWLEIPHMSDQPIVSSIGTSLYRNNVGPGQPAWTSNAWQPARMVGSFTYNITNFQVNCTAPVLSNATRPEGALSAVSTVMNMTAMPSDLTKPRELYFWNWLNDTHSFSSTCNVTNTTVEIDALCTAATCKPTRMRNMGTSARTLLDSDLFANSLFDSFMLACGTPLRPGDFSIFDDDNGLVDLRNALNENELNSAEDLEQACNDAQFPLSMAVTRYMNTYFKSSQMLVYDQAFENDLAVNGSINLNNNIDFTFLTMYGAQYEPQYSLSWPWLAMDIVSNLVLLAAGVCAFWLRKHTLAPDIFGFVSSLTRDNPHLQLPEGGSTLDGIDRSRRMKHIKVKIADVSDSNSVGRVGLTQVDESSGYGVRDLEKGKTYY